MHFRTFTATTILLAAAATTVSAVSSCVAGLRPMYQYAFEKQIEDATYALCYDEGNRDVDQNWRNDIGAMMQTLLDSNVCCVTCIADAGKNGCTGLSQLTKASTCPLTGSDPGSRLTQTQVDGFLAVIDDAIAAGVDNVDDLPKLQFDLGDQTGIYVSLFTEDDEC